MPEYNVPQVQRSDGTAFVAQEGKPLVFTGAEVSAASNLVSLKFTVGPNNLTVMVARATAHDLLETLEQVLEV